MKMTSPLDNLCGPTGDLAHEAPDEEEYAHHIDNGLTKLNDAKKQDLSLGSRFDLAYNAAFHLSLAALRRIGYRPKDKRYIVFLALPHNRATRFVRQGSLCFSAQPGRCGRPGRRAYATIAAPRFMAPGAEYDALDGQISGQGTARPARCGLAAPGIGIVRPGETPGRRRQQRHAPAAAYLDDLPPVTTPMFELELRFI